MNKPTIKTCEYRDNTWHIETECGMNRTVTYGELKRSMAGTDGICFHFEHNGMPLPFDEAVHLLNMKENRHDLWFRLEYIILTNEIKRERRIETIRLLHATKDEQRQQDTQPHAHEDHTDYSQDEHVNAA